MQQRHTDIINLVNEKGRASVGEMSTKLGVSEVTIRHDLNKLEKEGFIRRVHGGATPHNTDNVSHRITVNYEHKRKMAMCAASIVEHGETVMIEGGSANALLAKELGKRSDVTIITPSSYIAHLMKETDVKIIVLGGLYQHESESMVGTLTRLCIKHTHFTKAFLGIDGLHPNTGFTSRNMMRADVGVAILEKGAQNIVITDSSKFGQVHNTPLYQFDQVDMVITDEDASLEYVHLLEKHNIKVVK